MNIQDNGTRSALLQALRTPGLTLDDLDAGSDALAPEAAPETAGSTAPSPAVIADPAEALLRLDVWQNQPTRNLIADAALPAPAGDAAAQADRLAEHVLAALG